MISIPGLMLIIPAIRPSERAKTDNRDRETTHSLMFRSQENDKALNPLTVPELPWGQPVSLPKSWNAGPLN
jgi:hypothetical protein